MKRLITSLSVLFLFAAARADGFGPSDKVLYFNSETLIAVIKDTFPQNLQLDVANKYVELMDSKGNVSIDDLITVCGVGKLDNAKCKNFIRDLINTMGDDTIKPFYWADYVTVSPEPIRLAVFSSGDGYHKNAGLDSGEWAITFGWMKESNFMRQYPQTKYLRGISACTNESGTKNVADASRNFALNEQSGEQCWCKMTGPEESAWVYTRGDEMAGGCARSCALECVSALRTEPMRAAMFTAVKLNGSNANTNDEKVIGDALKDEFKPCEFDWAKDTIWGGSGEADLVKNTLWHKYRPKGNIPQFIVTGQEVFSNELNEWEWTAGGAPWMRKENFQCRYPGANKIRGTATLNETKGVWLEPTNQSFNSKKLTGAHCWCKMTWPEESKWIYAGDLYNPYGNTPDDDYNICLYNCGWMFIRRGGTGGHLFDAIGKK